jgi:XrtJ-associated TM-motif-TM protein
MKKLVLFAAFVVVVAVATPLNAQSGCVNSPENPTALLAVVGSAGAFIAAARARFRRK